MSNARKGKEFGARVKAAAFKRCGGPDAPKCEKCGRYLLNHRFDFDHRIAIALGGDNSLENCEVLCAGGRATCHGVKSAEEDMPVITKADNQRKQQLGLKPPPVVKIESKPFPKREKRRAVGAGLPPLAPRRLFVD